MSTLEGSVATLRWRMGSARAFQWGAIGLGAGALCALAGAGPFGLLGGVFAWIGWFTRPTETEAVQRLDATLKAEGAVVCAWDHRIRSEAMAAALRRRVEQQLTDATVRAAAPPAHPAWALAPLVWVAVLLQPTAPDATTTDAAVSARAADAGLLAAPGTAPDAAPGSGALPAPTADAGARTRPTPPDAGTAPPTADAGPAGGGDVARSHVAGVGERAGDQRAQPVSAQRVGLSPGTAAGIWLAHAGGEALPGTAERAATPVVGRAPGEDDISDPARPFSPHYRPVIAAWFHRDTR